jgi:hypothetical protein
MIWPDVFAAPSFVPNSDIFVSNSDIGALIIAAFAAAPVAIGV